ncbi:MAG: hypothetical protein ACRDOH_24955 [Streptosporangiaceae bacterium]
MYQLTMARSRLIAGGNSWSRSPRSASAAFSEGISDTGDLTSRGGSHLRGAITGAGTFPGGILHTLPFLIPQYRPAVLPARAVIALELLALAWIRRRFFGTSFLSSLMVTPGGAIIATISAAAGCTQMTAGDTPPRTRTKGLAPQTI